MIIIDKTNVKYILHTDKYKRLFLQKILQKSYEASEHFQHGVGIFIQTYYLKNGFFPQDSALPTKCLTVLQ